MLVIAVDHLEQVLRRRILMRQNKGAQPVMHGRAVIEPAADVRGAPLLPALQDQRPDTARPLPLILQAHVNVPLRPVEYQRLDRT